MSPQHRGAIADAMKGADIRLIRNARIGFQQQNQGPQASTAQRYDVAPTMTRLASK